METGGQADEHLPRPVIFTQFSEVPRSDGFFFVRG